MFQMLPQDVLTDRLKYCLPDSLQALPSNSARCQDVTQRCFTVLTMFATMLCLQAATYGVQNVL